MRAIGAFREGGEVDRATTVISLLRPFLPYMHDDGVNEICVNRPGEIWTEGRGIWQRHEAELTLEHMRSLATAVARYANNDVSQSRPILSAVLAGNERVQFVLEPACETGTVSMTIRKPSKMLRTFEQYRAEGFFDGIKPVEQGITGQDSELRRELQAGNIEAFLKKAVRFNKTIIIAGATGSGKTTFMKSLMQEIPQDERLITIEDVPELFLPSHPNHVHLFYPSEAKEADKAPVTAAVLLRSCLRMKPTRILLAELRGGETFDFLNVCLSGHGGSITSIHAGNCAQTFDRLGLMVLQNQEGRTLPYQVIGRLIGDVVDIVVHVHSDGQMRDISEIWFEPDRKPGRLATGRYEL
jgi:type IV secretion system protein VirB11